MVWSGDMLQVHLGDDQKHYLVTPQGNAEAVEGLHSNPGAVEILVSPNGVYARPLGSAGPGVKVAPPANGTAVRDGMPSVPSGSVVLAGAHVVAAHSDATVEQSGCPKCKSAVLLPGGTRVFLHVDAADGTVGKIERKDDGIYFVAGDKETKIASREGGLGASLPHNVFILPNGHVVQSGTEAVLRVEDIHTVLILPDTEKVALSPSVKVDWKGKEEYRGSVEVEGSGVYFHTTDGQRIKIAGDRLNSGHVPAGEVILPGGKSVQPGTFVKIEADGTVKLPSGDTFMADVTDLPPSIIGVPVPLALKSGEPYAVAAYETQYHLKAKRAERTVVKTPGAVAEDAESPGAGGGAENPVASANARAEEESAV